MTDSGKTHGHELGALGITYASAGVDIEAGDRAVDLFKPLATKATRPEVRGGLGGFAGLFALRGGYREPVLAASTDGVGTKLAVAQAMDKHDTVGLDLVAMVVDDLVVCGAEPLFLQDYIAVGRDSARAAERDRRRHRRGVCARGLCAARRRDRGAPRPDGTGPLRPLGHRRRRGRGRRSPGARPGETRGRHHRDGVFRPAFQRILAGPQGPAGDRPDEPGRLCRGVRPYPRRRVAGAHPDLRQRLSGAGRRNPRPHVLPRHRWRAGRQPAARHPARIGQPRSTAALGRPPRCST